MLSCGVCCVHRTSPTASNPLTREYLECWQPVDPTEYQNEWLGDVVSAPSGPLYRTFLRLVHTLSNTLLQQGLWYGLTAQMAAESLCLQINIY